MMFYAFQLDERTKKIILVLVALFIIILLIFGTIYYFTERYMVRESRKMDDYMYDLVKYRKVKNPKEFKAALDYQEMRMFFNGTKAYWRVIIIVTLIAVVVVLLSFDKNFKGFFTEFFKLFPTLKWTTIKNVNDSLPEDMQISGPGWFPVSLFPTIVSKNPDFTSALLYASSIYYIFIIISGFFLIRGVLAHIARYTRGLRMKDDIFLKSLDNLDIGSLDNLTKENNNNNNSNNQNN